jgi:hypothetical protein
LDLSRLNIVAYDATPPYAYMAQRGNKMNGKEERKGLKATALV